MQFGLILGGIFLAFLALTKKKVKNPDPLAAANEAEELSSPQAKFLRIQNSLDVIGKTKKIVLDVGQLTRLNDAIYRAKYGQLFFGIDRSGNYRGYKNKAAYRAYVESLYAPTSLMTYNRELAVRLAGQLADHIREYRGWYSINLVQDFQYAAGILDDAGQVSGRYGGRTMGALCYFMFEQKNLPCDYLQIPSPISQPKWKVAYRPPAARQLS